MAARLALAALLMVLSADASADVLYRVTLDGGRSLDAALAAGAVVRHVGNDEALVAGNAVLGEDLRRARHSCDVVAPLDDRSLLYICYPAGANADLGRYGAVLWSEPGGAVLVSTSAGAVEDLMAACFMAYPLPESVAADGWFDNEPPPHVRAARARDARAVRGLVEDVAASISADSLMVHVERLSEYPGGALRTRYVKRAECLTEAERYLLEELAAVLPAGSPVDTQRFAISGHTCEGGATGPVVDYPAHNVVGVLEGSGDLGGCYIVSAHYDATAQSSFQDGYWWCDNAAPGADDNATGVAVLLEAARALADVSLPFDVRFALFTGEELGLLGSGVYADSVAAEGDTIYGVFNVDMVAYKLAGGNPDTCHIVTNPGSKWLADWLVETVEQHPDPFAGSSVLRIDQALAYSDHASFWRNGYDAVIAIEHVHAGSRNPVYHTLGDTLGHVSASQLAIVARLVAGSVARLADPDTQINLAVFPEDIGFYVNDLEIGRSVSFSVDVHAFGPSEPVDATIRVWDGEPGDGGDLLFQASVTRPLGWGEVIRHEFTWELEPDDLGEHTVTAVVSAPGTDELTLADNEAAVSLRVDAPTLFVANHYVYPNPVSLLDGMAFRYELSRECRRVALRVFDLTGQEMGAGYSKVLDVSAGDGANEGVLAGWNTVSWESVAGAAMDLASGVYVYRLEVYASGSTEPDDAETGKFAVLR